MLDRTIGGAFCIALSGTISDGIANGIENRVLSCLGFDKIPIDPAP